MDIIIIFYTFTPNMNSAIAEIKEIISYNLRRLRFLHKLSISELVQQVDITLITVHNCETGKHIGLESLLKLCVFYKVTLAQITQEKLHSEHDTLLKSFKKLQSVRIVDIPFPYKHDFKNFCAKEDACCSRADYNTWLNFIEYNGRFPKQSERVSSVVKLLGVGESVNYEPKSHIKFYGFLLTNNSNEYTLRNNQGVYACTKIK